MTAGRRYLVVAEIETTGWYVVTHVAKYYTLLSESLIVKCVDSFFQIDLFKFFECIFLQSLNLFLSCLKFHNFQNFTS